ncbi:hypothetical protein OAU50_02325 [Planctomycetota bacterium]|nr:hypothetical protein [Planctomycetota bacterium]
MGLEGKQYILIHCQNVVDEADFFTRIFNASPHVVDETTRLIDTGAFTLRLMQADDDRKITRNVQIEITVNSVNLFAEEVWNRGVKYASRPQNHKDGVRRVGFVSPSDVRVYGAGPLKMDSTGAFPVFRPEGN